MKINFEQMYHGAALTQIAEHRHFTAINVIRSGGSPHRSAFCLNKSICVYLKYARHPTKSYGEYVFTFTTRHLEDLRRLRKRYGDVFLALICVDDLEICCLQYSQFQDMIQERQAQKGKAEGRYSILATLPEAGKFSINMNMPDMKKRYLIHPPIRVARNAFPGQLFD